MDRTRHLLTMALLVGFALAGSLVLSGGAVVAVSASQVHVDPLIMVAHVAGLALVVCAFPLGERVEAPPSPHEGDVL